MPNRDSVEREQLPGLMVSQVLVPCGGSWGSREAHTEEARKQDEKMPVFMDIAFSHPLLLNPSRARSSSLSEFSLQAPAQKHPKVYFTNLVGVL